MDYIEYIVLGVTKSQKRLSNFHFVNHPALKRFYFVDIHLDNRRGKWQATLVFLPRESHGQRSLVGYSPWGRRVRHH